MRRTAECAERPGLARLDPPLCGDTLENRTGPLAHHRQLHVGGIQRCQNGRSRWWMARHRSYALGSQLKRRVRSVRSMPTSTGTRTRQASSRGTSRSSLLTRSLDPTPGRPRTSTNSSVELVTRHSSCSWTGCRPPAETDTEPEPRRGNPCHTDIPFDLPADLPADLPFTLYEVVRAVPQLVAATVRGTLERVRVRSRSRSHAWRRARRQ